LTSVFHNNKISYFRKKRGLTQTDLRDKIYQMTGRKVRQATISGWEKGIATPASQEVLAALATILFVKVEDLYEKGVLQEDNTFYDSEVKSFEEILQQVEILWKKHPDKAHNLLKINYTKLLDKLISLSESNQKLKAKFNSMSELLRS